MTELSAIRTLGTLVLWITIFVLMSFFTAVEAMVFGLWLSRSHLAEPLLAPSFGPVLSTGRALSALPVF